MKHKRMILVVAALILIGKFDFAGAESTATLSAQNITLGVNRLGETQITISSSEGVAAVGINLSYDPAVIELISASAGNFTYWFGFFYPGNGSTPGYAMINTYVLSNLTGNLTVATVAFRAIGSIGDSSPFIISPIVAANISGRNLPITGYNATISINFDPDVNQDDVVDIFDAKKVRNVLDGDPTPCPRCRVLGNNNVTVFDIVAVIENVD